MTARIVPDDDAGRVEAVRLLEAGGIVALPTDTVYGLAAWLGAPGAIDRLFAAKRRPADRAIVLLLADAGQAGELVSWPATAAELADAFWPGALTIVVGQNQGVTLPPELTGGRPTIGLRLADHPSPRSLAARLGPLPVTSANLSGLPEATDAGAIHEQLGDAIDLILDGGPARGGAPSTVVDCSGTGVRVLRPGAVSSDALAAALRRAGLAEPSL